jgi:hypothetical protein
MDTHALRATYDGLLAVAQAGDFHDPSAGEWSAAMVLAHVATNDGLLTEVTRQVAAGHAITYDNAAANTESRLRGLAEELGWDGLIAEVRRRADLLIEAVDALDSAHAETLVDSRIVDAGQVRVDDTVPWSRLLLAQAHTHIPMHTRQLAALRAS